ncbi:DUF1353 domain-containing protein [Thalassotalea castellviae]|uniref:DUF1353 domain-containing protein n=1 Tax=Thalassotalea castellviae TaxID=3075612 RepID=A0ABU3A1R4_9GAMM|nr:DUF1353 domain-containing protein [Thalassotalea sp. W431]MDT0603482.1 DUF1353 domain-containing protein [Thalassotalea sp. W431]
MASFSGEVLARWLEKREMELLQQTSFTDDNGHEWIAPKGAIVDGASIPRLFWFLVGSPFVGKYRRASVIHDVYCKTKSIAHKQVHKMFYNAMRCDGVGRIKAKTMYLAVKLGGPKW